jgi:predicted amidohydrolase YtcJ
MMASCKAVVFLPLAVLLALGIPATAVAQNAQNAKLRPADSILANGQVYTEKGAPSWAQAVAVRGEKIIAVGDDAGILKPRGPATKALDAGGKLVLPGFVDGHIHFMEGSISLGQANFDGAKNPAEIQHILREYANKHPGNGWILGGGWNYAMFGEENLPNKKYLDELFPNRKRGQ